MIPIPLEEPRSECCDAKFIEETDLCSDCKEHTDAIREEIEEELIHKRMNDINTFQAHENEVYLRGTDEYGKDFQICFDSYNFLEWIDTEHLEYIKEQLTKYIKTK
jgi:hypothetical protein